MATDVAAAGVANPSMWITRDAATMRLERKRAGGWSEAEIDAHKTSMRAAHSALPGAGCLVQVPDSAMKPPPGYEDRIVNAAFCLGETELMADDGMARNRPSSRG